MLSLTAACNNTMSNHDLSTVEILMKKKESTAGKRIEERGRRMNLTMKMEVKRTNNLINHT